VFPRGWFVVAFADEVTFAPTPLGYFGQTLTLERTDRGASVVDARGRAWRTLERNGLVLVHHDPAGPEAEPEFDIPVLREHGDPGWQPWIHKCMRLRTHSREIVENVADRAHFLPVHDTVNVAFETEFEGHRATQRSRGHGGAHPEVTFTSEATYFGPGYQITQLETLGVRSLLLNAHTMLAPDLLDLRFGVMMQRTRHSLDFARSYVEMLQEGFEQDVRIWEHKVWRDHPVLCDGDGPIMKLRRWYAQFYAPRSGSQARP
jgi:3-ketosteroid 9alpha-monooxygenase subunit A